MYNLILIEDNSQAPDALHHNAYTGTIGDMGVFSFNRHKVMQSGEGGMLICKKENLYQKASLFRNHGEAVVESFNIQDITNTAGLNLRMTEIEAAIALEQFKKLQDLTSIRRALANRLTENLESITVKSIVTFVLINGNKSVLCFYMKVYS